MSEPNLHQLRIFARVARLGSFSRAARELSISQPAVSVQVQELERTYRLPLLQRLGRKIVPTEAGELVLRYVTEIFSLVESLDSGIAELQGVQRGSVTIGATTSVAEMFLPALLRRFNGLLPTISTSVQTIEPGKIIERLVSGEIGLGFACDPPFAAHIDAQPIGTEDWSVIAAPDHRYARRRAIPVAALRPERWILFDSTSEVRAGIQSFALGRGLQLQPALELTTCEGVKRAVAAGLGIALVPSAAIPLEVQAGGLAVLDVPELAYRRTIALLHHHQRRLSRAEATLVELAKPPDLAKEPAREVRG